MSLTEADRNLGTYLMGIIKGYYEGYEFGSNPTPETGRDGEGDRSALGAAASPPPHPTKVDAGPGAPNPIASTDPGSDPAPEEEGKGEDQVKIMAEPEESALDLATRRGIVVGLRAIADEFRESGQIEASVIADRHADAMSVSSLRTLADE